MYRFASISTNDDPLIALLEDIFYYFDRYRYKKHYNFKFSRGPIEIEINETGYHVFYDDGYAELITNYKFIFKTMFGNTRIITGTYNSKNRYYDDEGREGEYDIVSDLVIEYDAVQVGNKRAI